MTKAELRKIIQAVKKKLTSVNTRYTAANPNNSKVFPSRFPGSMNPGKALTRQRGETREANASRESLKQQTESMINRQTQESPERQKQGRNTRMLVPLSSKDHRTHTEEEPTRTKNYFSCQSSALDGPRPTKRLQ